jgi:hypothetical protein
MTPQASEKMAKYFGIDPRKLRNQAVAAVKEEERIARLPREPKTKEEKQLHRSLHALQGADKRWQKLRKTGATNAELLKEIGEAMGEGGSITEDGWVDHKGGSDPKIWFNSSKKNNNTPPSLRGVALIAAVRDLLKIPEKGDVDA